MLIATNVASLGIVATVRALVATLEAGTFAPAQALAAWLVGLAIMAAATRIASRIWIFNAARAAEYDTRSALFGHVLAVDCDAHRNAKAGDIMARLTSDMQTVRAMWGAGFLNLINTPFAYATSLLMMFQLSPRLTLVAVAPYPLIYIVGQFMGKRLYKASQRVQQQVALLSNELQETFGNIQLVKSYGLGPARRALFAKTSHELLMRNMELVAVRGQLAPILGLLAGAGSLLVLWIGGQQAAAGDGLGVDDLVAFTLLVGRLVWPTLALGWMISLVSRGNASWQRIEALMQLPLARATQLSSDATAPTVHDVAIDVRGLTIERDGHRLVDDLHFRLPAGSFTAVVGPTGAGKSTLLDSLAMLTRVAPDVVFVNGRDATDMPEATLRRLIGYCPQEAFLFSTTIADNIAMGVGEGRALPSARADELEDARFADRDVDPNDPRIVAAGAAAALSPDIAAMPLGYGTVVGERGITLSGGQRQRVALARTVIARHPVVLLDDSLSSVDAKTEQAILAALEEFGSARTVVMVSHRLAAIRRADQILVLDKGRLAALGTHADLVANCPIYRELYQAQVTNDHA